MVAKNLFDMSSFGNIIIVFIEKCYKARRYSKDGCLFNARLIFSLMLSLNLISFACLLFGNQWALERLFFSRQPSGNVLMLLIPVSFFVLLTLIFPKKKLFSAELTPSERRNSLIYLAIYVTSTIIFVAISSFVSFGLFQ